MSATVLIFWLTNGMALAKSSLGPARLSAVDASERNPPTSAMVRFSKLASGDSPGESPQLNGVEPNISVESSVKAGLGPSAAPSNMTETGRVACMAAEVGERLTSDASVPPERSG